MSWKNNFLCFPLCVTLYGTMRRKEEILNVSSVQGSVAPLLLSWMVIGVGKEGKDFCSRPALRVEDVRHSPTQTEEEQSYICIPEEHLDLWGAGYSGHL